MTVSKTVSYSIILAGLAGAAVALAILLPAAIGHASEGMLLLSPTGKWVKPGESMTIEVQLTSRTRVNAVEGTVTYPKDLLTATGVSTDGTIVTLWAEEPAINASQGTVRFAGGITGGFFGSGKVVSMNFRADKAGMARVTIEDSSVLAHDGLGTAVTGVPASGRYTLQQASPDRVFLEPGSLIKLPDDSNPDTQVDTAVYYYGEDGRRYVFPNSKTYFTWFSDFSGVKVVPLTQLQSIRIGGNVTYRPGVQMIKIDSDPKVYAVGQGGSLRWVKTEALAVALYGSDWNKKIDDVPDSFFTNYNVSSAVNVSTDFIPAERTAATVSIGVDKSMHYPVEVFMNSDGSFTPAVVTVKNGGTARFTNSGTSAQRVKATAEAGLPGLDSGPVETGMDYVYRFDRAGSFGLFNAGDTSKTATVVVQ